MIPATNAPRSSHRWNWKVLMLSTTIVALLYTLLWFGGLRDRVSSFGKPTQTATAVGKEGGSVGGSDGDIILKGDGNEDGYEPPQTTASRAPSSPILRTKATGHTVDMPPPPLPTSAAKDDDIHNSNRNIKGNRIHYSIKGTAATKKGLSPFLFIVKF